MCRNRYVTRIVTESVCPLLENWYNIKQQPRTSDKRRQSRKDDVIGWHMAFAKKMYGTP